MLYKYPKTPYLPWSPGHSERDWRISELAMLDGRSILMTEKMDGENTTLYRDTWHARSLDSPKNLPWREMVNSLFYQKIYGQIPESMRICGENMYAVHSIFYDNLDDYFLVHSVWEDEWCLSWPETTDICNELGLTRVPVVGFGNNYDQKFLESFIVPENCEGYVIRPYDRFNLKDFDKLVAKYVRKDHVQTDEHWTRKKMVKNELYVGEGR